MVCNRCIMFVKQELEKLNIDPLQVNLGEVVLRKPLKIKEQNLLKERLELLGFELLDDQKQKLIEKIKNILIAVVQSGDIPEHFSITKALQASIHKDYPSLSRLFSEVEGITIEQFFIMQKAEKVKELLVYGELNLNEISFRLGYSSVAHLSAQFKKLTGLTPSYFKKAGAAHRRSLDDIHNN